MTVRQMWWKYPLVMSTAILAPRLLARSLAERADVIHATDPQTADRLRTLAADLATTRRRTALSDLMRGSRADSR